jgi:hypothetical protein
MSSTATDLLRHVGRWPFVRVTVRGRRATVHGGGTDLPLAVIDLAEGTLAAYVPADLGRRLVRREPAFQLTRDGVRIALVDDASRRAGERLLRRRIDLERYGAQMRESSP